MAQIQKSQAEKLGHCVSISGSKPLAREVSLPRRISSCCQSVPEEGLAMVEVAVELMVKVGVRNIASPRYQSPS